jgi:hypothetical protein
LRLADQVLKKLEAIQAKRKQQQEAHQKQQQGAEGAAEIKLLTPRQKRQAKAKAKIERRKQRKKEQQTQSPSEGRARGEQQEGGQQVQPERKPPNQSKQVATSPKQQREVQRRKPDGSSHKGRDKAFRESSKPGAATAGGRQQQREVIRKRGQELPRGVGPSKRSREDAELDALAEGALAEDGGQQRRRRARRGLGAERTERLDRLAEAHVAKRSGGRDGESGSSRGTARQQQQAGITGHAARVQKVQLGLEAGSVKRWFDDG